MSQKEVFRSDFFSTNRRFNYVNIKYFSAREIEESCTLPQKYPSILPHISQ